MNYLSKYLVLLFLSFLQFSCYKDNSTQDTRMLSEIQVAFNEVTAPTINIDKNEVLTVDPVITQTETEKSLTYEWQVNYEVVSTEKKLTYSGSRLGSYFVRLKVSNEDGSTFKSFTLNVNSPYEEGLFVLGQSESGEGTISFMRTYSEEEKAAGKVESFATNCFAVNNPGLTLGKLVTDVVKRADQLYISSEEDAKISLINTKTFELESVITAPEFPDFKPYRLNVPDNSSTSSIVLCRNGKLYNLATKEHLVLQNTVMRPDVELALETFVVPTSNFTSNYFWDKTHSRFWNLWYTNSNSKDTLAGQELIQFFATVDFSYILTRDKNNPASLTKSVFGPYIQVFFADPLDYKEKTVFTNPAPTLTENSITVLNEKYKKLVYANNRSIYGWYYSGINIPASPYITIGIPGTITALNVSADETKLYVGVYNEAASGLKGSILVYNIDNGALISKYEGIADKPVKLFYKKKD